MEEGFQMYRDEMWKSGARSTEMSCGTGARSTEVRYGRGVPGVQR